MGYFRKVFRLARIRIKTLTKNIKKGLTTGLIYDIILFVDGASPSGKASDSDSDISGVRIPVPQPRKKPFAKANGFFQLNPPLAGEIHLRWMKSLRDEIPLRGMRGGGFNFI